MLRFLKQEQDKIEKALQTKAENKEVIIIQEDLKGLVSIEDFQSLEIRKNEKFQQVVEKIESLDTKIEDGISVIYRYDEVISDKASKLTVELLEKRLLEQYLLERKFTNFTSSYDKSQK